jgi:hypothetical protein
VVSVEAGELWVLRQEAERHLPDGAVPVLGKD